MDPENELVALLRMEERIDEQDRPEWDEEIYAEVDTMDVDTSNDKEDEALTVDEELGDGVELEDEPVEEPKAGREVCKRNDGVSWALRSFKSSANVKHTVMRAGFRELAVKCPQRRPGANHLCGVGRQLL